MNLVSGIIQTNNNNNDFKTIKKSLFQAKNNINNIYLYFPFFYFFFLSKTKKLVIFGVVVDIFLDIPPPPSLSATLTLLCPGWSLTLNRQRREWCRSSQPMLKKANKYIAQKLQDELVYAILI